MIEATASNTGLGLALVAAQKGVQNTGRCAGQDEPGEDFLPHGSWRGVDDDPIGCH